MKDSEEIKYSEEISDVIIDIMTKGESNNTSQLEEWLVNDDNSQDTINNLTDGDWLRETLNSYERVDKMEKLSQLQKAINRYRLRRRMMAASIAAAIVAVSMIVYNLNNHNNTPLIVEKSEITQPMLITGGGVSIAVDIVDKKEVIKISSITQSQDKEVIKVEESVQYNRFINPARYSSKIELEDGTVVHLNGNSELIFPEKFSDTKREVTLVGEGYFEVTPSNKRFIVQSGDVEIAVYGTKFNVNSTEDGIVKTVLVEGKVGVKINNSELQLSPNELCVANTKSGDITKEEVDVTKYIAWVTGMFIFENDSFGTLLTQLSEWYDVDFVLENKDLEDVSITVLFPRNEELNDVIETLSMLNIDVEFIKTERGYIIR